MMRFFRDVAALAMIGLASPAIAATDTVDRSKALFDRSQAAIGTPLPDVAFRDTNGKTVRLSDYRGRPLLVTLIYTGCTNICPTLIANMIPAVEAANAALGTESFSVVTVGFDLRQDTPDRLRAFARERGAELPNWTFLAADQPALDALAAAVGFGFFSRPGGFDHFAQVSLVDGEGRLQGQVYGSVFDPPVIVDPLKALVFNRAAPISSFDRLVDRIKFFCTTYDPNSGRYYFNYSLFIGIGIGLLSFAVVGTMLVREWRRTSEGRAGSP
jgi:protein SCO1/2